MAQYTLSLAVSGGDANVGITSGGIHVCAGPTNADCTHTYDDGTLVTLDAFDSLSPNFGFDHWEGACTGTSRTCTVTMDQAQSVTAVFAPALTVTVELVSPLRSSCLLVGCVYFYGFDGGVSWSGGTCTTTAPLVPPNAGSPATHTSICTIKTAGGSLELTAFSNEAGVEFVSWFEACTGSTPTCTINVTENVTVGALFATTF